MIELTQEQRMILHTVKDIAKKKIKPRAAEIDEKAEFPLDTVKTYADNGILAPLLPEKYGGIGAEYLIFSMILEEIAKVCASSALILIAQADGMPPILCGGSEELKIKYLPGLNKGKLAAIAATEPEAGSDILSMRTHAVRKGDVYVVNGQKIFTTIDGAGMALHPPFLFPAIGLPDSYVSLFIPGSQVSSLGGIGHGKNSPVMPWKQEFSFPEARSQKRTVLS